MKRQRNFTLVGKARLKLEVLSYATTWKRICDSCNKPQISTTESKITDPLSSSYDSAYFALCHSCTNTLFFPALELLECHTTDLVDVRKEVIARMEMWI